MKKRMRCEACLSSDLTDVKFSRNIIELSALRSTHFKVTDKSYGSCVKTVRCRKCGLIQPYNILKSSEIVKLYNDMTDVQYINDSEARGISNFYQLKNILKKHISLDGNRYHILEIGSGSGALLNILMRKDHYTTGIEPSKHLCEFAINEFGLNIINSGYESYSKKGKFDLILAFDLIEHVSSPKEFAAFLSEKLGKDGFIVIVTPNANSIASKTLKKRWWHIRPPHLFYFSDKSIKALFEQFDFKIVKTRNFHWTFPLSYILQTLQQFVFGKIFFEFSFLKMKICLNTFDSRIYLLKKAG